VAEDESDVPRSLHNIVVSIHAIATFHALNDYLRPRVSGILASAHRSQLQASVSPSSMNSCANAKPHAESSKAYPIATSDSNNGTTDGQSPPNSASSITRRRSQRLKTKTTGENNAPIDGSTENDEENSHDPDETQLLQPTEALDELTDDELDGGLLGTNLETDDAVADKTVNLSVLDGNHDYGNS
jgi:E3 ubiquitin-protein ligase TRIP12